MTRDLTRKDAAAPLDEIDTRLLEVLSVDGRRTYSDLSHDLQLSETAVARRVSALTAENWVYFLAMVDPVVPSSGTLTIVTRTIGGIRGILVFDVDVVLESVKREYRYPLFTAPAASDARPPTPKRPVEPLARRRPTTAGTRVKR